jgi:ribosomal protein S8
MLPPSDKYNVPKLDDNNAIHHTADNVQDIITIMKNLDKMEYNHNKVNILYTSNIQELVKYMHDNGFNPEVNTISKVRVTNIKFANIKHGDNLYHVCIMVPFTHDGANEEENNVSIEYFNMYRKEMNKFQTSIITKKDDRL